MPTLYRFIEAAPVLVSVMLWDGLVVWNFCGPKVRLGGVKVAAGTVPSPLKLMLGAGSMVVLLTIMPATRFPSADGVNVTLIAQLADTAKVLPQPFAIVKSPPFVPLRETPVIFKGACPVLTTLRICGALVVRIFCPLKEILRPGEKLMVPCGGGA